MSIEWKRRLTILGIIAGTIGVYRYLLPVLLPFLTAWILASWLHPIALRLQNRTKIRKSVWGTALVAAVLGVLALLLYLGAKEILNQLKTAVVNFPHLLKWGSLLLDKCCVLLEEAAGIPEADSRGYILARVSGLQNTFLEALSPKTLMGMFSFARKILTAGSGAVVAVISAILMITDMEALQRKIREYSWLTGIRRVVKQLKKTTIVYLKAQVILIALVAAVCAAGFWMMKNPYFLILGILLGFLDALPIIGTGTFLYPAALVFLIRGELGTALCCVLLDIFTSVLREFLEPRLLGGKLGVSPIMVIASVYIGVFLFGGWGVFLGPLSFSTIYETGKVCDIWD